MNPQNLNRRLFAACSAGDIGQMELLLAAGADANAFFAEVFPCSQYYPDMRYMTPLLVYLDRQKAYSDSEVEAMLPGVKILLKYEADLNHIAEEIMPGYEHFLCQWTSLSYSMFPEGTQLMEFLLAAGADPNLIRTDDGGTLLDWAYIDLYSIPFKDDAVRKKITLLKKYGAKSVFNGEIQ